MNINKLKKDISLSLTEDQLLTTNENYSVLVQSSLILEKIPIEINKKTNIQKPTIRRSLIIKKEIKNFIIGPVIINTFYDNKKFLEYFTNLTSSSFCYFKYKKYISDLSLNKIEDWNFENNKTIYFLFNFFQNTVLLPCKYLEIQNS
jgi:hypothetical protein